MRITLGELRRVVQTFIVEQSQAPFRTPADAKVGLSILKSWYASDYPNRDELHALMQMVPYRGIAYRVAVDEDDVNPPRSWSGSLTQLQRYVDLASPQEAGVGELIVLGAQITGWDIATYAKHARRIAGTSNSAADQIIDVGEVVSLVEPSDVEVVGYVDQDGQVVTED